MPMTTTEQKTLNSLLRGELSAIETYRMALEKLAGSNDPRVGELERIRADHREAADALWHVMESRGERPAEGSGPWGAFAKAIEGTAKLFGDTAALKALKEGEEHGLEEYEDALEDDDVSPELRTLLQRLMSRQRAHTELLDRMIAAK